MKGKLPRFCPVCGAEFTPKSGSQIYCSPKCARAAGVDKNRERIYARSAIKAKQDPRLLYAFNFECAICRWSAPSLDAPDGSTLVQAGCEFHHITPVREGGTDDANNLILLCPNCHSLADHGFYSRQFLRAHTRTIEDAIRMRTAWSIRLGVGTYWVDDVTINRDKLKAELETSSEKILRKTFGETK